MMFGEKLFPRNEGIPTPTSIPDINTDLLIRVPASADWWAIVCGMVESLTHDEAWQQLDGGISREAAAEKMIQIYYEMIDCASGGCVDCCDVLGLKDALKDAELQVVDGVPQASFDGGTTWIDVPDRGSDILPVLVATNGADNEEKICNASWRATLVLAELYRQTFGAFSADVLTSVRSVFKFLNSVANVGIEIVKTMYPGIISGAILYNEYPYTDMFVDATLTTDQKNDLKCLLVESASVSVDGIVTFDFEAVQLNLVSTLGFSPGFALTFLNDFIGAAGLNQAGTVGNATGDCATCDETPCEFEDHFTSGVRSQLHPMSDFPFSQPWGDYGEWSASGGHDDPGSLHSTNSGADGESISGYIDLLEDCLIRGLTLWIKDTTGTIWKQFKHYDAAGNLLRTVNQGDFPPANTWTQLSELPSAGMKRYIAFRFDSWPGLGPLVVDDIVIVP